MNNHLKQKQEKLKKVLQDLQSVVLAYSGGVDSTYLLKISLQVLGKNKVLAVIATSPIYPSREIKEAIQMVRRWKTNYELIATKELNKKEFVNNPVNRCYYCKQELFSQLIKIRDKYNLGAVLDGSNYSDLDDFRPGNLAAQELGVRSPLKEVGLTKEDIRYLCRDLNLSIWDKPSFACLASRIPYNQKINKEKLSRIDKAEVFLIKLGFRQVRVRDYDDLARIEISGGDEKILSNEKIKKEIIKNLKKLGYIYVTLDLEGYRSGSMNEILKSRGRLPKPYPTARAGLPRK